MKQPDTNSNGSILWPGMVFVLIGISLTLMTITAVLAVTDRSFAVEEDYYAKAVAWDDSAEARERSLALGWVAEVSLASALDLSGERAVTVIVCDRDGVPVDATPSQVFAFHHARRGEPVTFDVARIAPGRYAAGAPLLRDGLWQLRLRFERGDDVFLVTTDASTDEAGASG